MDPEQLSDALMSAGVDLREEENLLSSSVHAAHVPGAPGAAPPPMDLNTMFLDIPRLHAQVERLAQQEGVRYALDYERPELAGLVSAACSEWIAEIVTQAAMYSRHRRMGKAESQSAVSKALKTISQQDRDLEQRRQNLKLSLGIGESSNKDDSEETQQRAANETARMMASSGGPRYSWLSGGAASARRPTTRTRQSEANRIKEVKQDPGIVLRDLLAALEDKHMGVKKTLVKGYARVRD